MDDGGRRGNISLGLWRVVLTTSEAMLASQPFRAQDSGPIKERQARTNKTSRLSLGDQKPGAPCEFGEQNRRCSPTPERTVVWSQGGVCRLQTETGAEDFREDGASRTMETQFPVLMLPTLLAEEQPLGQELADVPCEGPGVRSLGLEAHRVYTATTHLCRCTSEPATDPEKEMGAVTPREDPAWGH